METGNGLGTCVFCRDNLHGSGVAREKSVQDENAGGKESSEGEATMVTETKDKEENVVKVENIGGKEVRGFQEVGRLGELFGYWSELKVY
jgi:hypothetical protein